MAYYAALASLVQLLDDIILHDRYPTLLLAKHPVVKSLHEKFTSLEDSLQDYSSNGDEVNDRLEGRIKDVACQAEDIIEIEISNQICLQVEISNQIGLQEITGISRTRSEEGMNNMKKCSPVSCFGCFRAKKFNKEDSIVEPETDSIVEPETNSIVEKLKMVEQEIDSILEEMMAIKERQQRSEEDSKLNWDSPTTSASLQTPAAKNIMVGFDEDLNIIKDQLCGQSSKLQVIPIVGMGGMGKTTLARNTFDDALVAYHFHCRVWVTVSQDYHENKVLQIISESLKSLMNELPGGERGDLKERIYKCLKGRRYLIVIDDIWSTQVWDDVMRIFPNDCNGSRIMLTTRLLDVARYAISPSGFLHEMQPLNKEQSWNLLQQKVFGEERCPSELKNIGVHIASKCCGLPLAVVVISGILWKFRTSHDHWEKVAGKVSTLLSTGDEHMNSILSLSYNHLPHHLKPCFLYMGSFPEDYQINISNLVRLWIAEGFLKSNDSSKFVEKVGEECLEDLVKRNLVLITQKRSNGQFKICILHDLVRDFCRQRAFYEKFFHVEDVEGNLCPSQNGTIRRINYYGALGGRHQSRIGKLVRSISLFQTGRLDFELFPWPNIRLLRVFNSSVTLPSSFHSFPKAFYQLVCLKYLSLRMLTCLNDSILRSVNLLQNIQTLRFQAAVSHNNWLGREFWQMTQLRHVIVSRMELESEPFRKLECLQTLMTVVDYVFTNKVIQMIPNLRKLKVQGRRRYTKSDRLKNLCHLPHLVELRIESYEITSTFAFPLNLKKLSISNCEILWEDMKIVGSLLHLQVLKLKGRSFVGEKWELNDEIFIRLKFLEFRELEFTCWQADCTHFPRLEYLRIRYCKELEMIPLEIGDIPTLKVIEVVGSENAGNSAILIQQEQQNLGNDVLQVRIHTHTYSKNDGRYMELSCP